MPRISQITPQKRKGIFNIYIDGKFAFGVDAETLVKEKITEDKNLSEEDVERLKEVSLYSKLLNNALNFLSFRPRSKKELSRNLKGKIYKLLGKGDTDLSGRLEDGVISKIESLGYLNDEEFARWWVEQRKGSRNPRGPALIKKELFAKGVDREIIEKFTKRSEDNVFTGNIAAVLVKKGRLVKDLPPADKRRKLYDFLLRRGFDYETVRTLVAEYLKKE